VEPFRFVLLGLGAGAAYALVAQGLVLIYRGAGIINFAQGAVGMVPALGFFELRDLHVPLGVALALSLIAAAALGVAIHLLVMRPLASAAPLVRLIATLAILVLLQTLVDHMSGGGFRPVQSILPSRTIRLVSGAPVGLDRYLLFLIAVVITLVLAVIYSRTKFGLATSAVAENSRSAAALGISPDTIASVNWAAAATLSTVAAILISSLNGSFNPDTLVLLVIPGLAAALVGGFSSFGLALAGGIAIGIFESEMGRYVTTPGWSEAGPFLVIILILVARGRALPVRGEVTEQASKLGSGRVSWPVAVGASAVLLALIWVVSVNWVSAITTTALAALVVLSLVVVAGYAGQLSLAQYALAGIGAWVSARLVAAQGLPVEVAALCGIIAAVGVGAVIGLASLRARGVNLAIATLGAALFVEQVVLGNPNYTGGTAGTQVGNLSVFGLHLDSVTHPQRFATVVVVILGLLMLLVGNLRRSAAGRRLIAIRGNERAAASLGVGIFGAKLYAFGLSSAIAAVGGILLAFQSPYVVFSPFTVLASITAVMQAVVGGIGYVSGALVGGTLQPGSIGQSIIEEFVHGSSATFILALIGAVGALVVLITQPNGVVSRRPWPFNRIPSRSRAPKAGSAGLTPGTAAGAVAGEVARLTPVEPATVEIRDLTVRFGGVTAVDRVSLRIQPGEIVGLIGPNGSGKTTLIDAVTGFVPVASGQVLLNGRAINRLNAVQRARAGIGRTFQSLELFPGMTVADNLRVASDRRGWDVYLTSLLHGRETPLTNTALGVARALELETDLRQAPEDLPFGRRRLVAIARSVANRPSVLLLDEPAAGLGPADTEDLGRLLRRLADDLGLAVMVVEHDLSLVTSACDRTVVLNRGAAIATGAPQSVLKDQAVIDAYVGVDEGAAQPVVASASVGGLKAEPVRVNGLSGQTEREPETLLATKDLQAGYGSLAAVRNLDLEVRAGEVVALLGPNGAGKTTTILTLAGALRPLSGQVLWHGIPSKKPLYRRARTGLGLVTEERSVFAKLTAEANLRLGRGDLTEALELFPELGPLLNRKGGLLSGGEQQILSLARVLAANPSVLLADELSLGLAPIIVNRLFQAIRQTADRGVGVLLVEQYTQRALEIADRVYVLNRGRLVLTAPAAELRKDPDRIRRSYLATDRIDDVREAHLIG
jgi:sulfate-transporting ATPase